MKRIMIIGACIAGLFSGGCIKQGLYDQEGKFRKNVTLEEIRSVSAEHGELTGVEYSHGGGMLGDVNRTELYRDQEGTPNIRVSYSGQHNWPLVVKEYTADESVFTALSERIDRDHLTLWDRLPFSDEIALDGPSTSIVMRFAVPSDERRRETSHTIRYDNVIPEGGRDILRDFVNTLHSAVVPGQCTAAYFVIDGENAVNGETADFQDDTIQRMLEGYWDTGTSQQKRLSLLGEPIDDVYEITEETDGSYVKHPCALKTIVHQPYRNAPCGWHLVLEDEAGKEWVMYMEDVSLIMEGEAERYILERNS